MQNKKYSGLLWILSFLPLVLILLCYTNLPQQVPLQWGFDGVVRYGEKKELLLIGGLSVIMGPMFLYLPRIDPRQENYKRFQRYYELLSLMTMGVLVLVTLMILSESFWPGRIVVYQAVTILVSVLFLTLGNLLPKVKNNFFMGVRTPWTLSDPDVWNRTNRLCGKLFFAAGLYGIPAALLLPEKVLFWSLMTAILAAALIPCVCSYFWYRQKMEKCRGSESGYAADITAGKNSETGECSCRDFAAVLNCL
ncbi:SdpI family protein [Angelakisella massiliensis]|uniref:SdpI family protein n=1 Tax=Angelakisella massiliensis TaxID=1871018 RepID=UPI0023A911D0|nr:SdpI family protein [Angelakisella massiliensis]